METTDTISYTFKERYFSLEKEKRIGKRQFQTRVFVPGILMAIPIIFLNGIIMAIFTQSGINFLFASIIIGVIQIFLFYGVSLFFLPTLIKKRCHDFGSSGKVESHLFIGGFILFLGVASLLIGEVFGFIPVLIPVDILFLVRDYLRYGIIGLGLYLMLRPGNKGKNEYGEDVSNVKIGLLG